MFLCFINGCHHLQLVDSIFICFVLQVDYFGVFGKIALILHNPLGVCCLCRPGHWPVDPRGSQEARIGRFADLGESIQRLPALIPYDPFECNRCRIFTWYIERKEITNWLVQVLRHVTLDSDASHICCLPYYANNPHSLYEQNDSSHRKTASVLRRELRRVSSIL
jgi:hypothetical protein